MAKLYPYGKKYLCIGMPSTGAALFSSGNLTNARMLLLWEGGAFNPAHQFVSDVIAGSLEMNGGSYARQTPGGLAIGVGGDYVVIQGNPVTFTALPTGHQTIAAILYFNTGSNSTSPVLAYYDGGVAPNDVPKDTNGGDLVVSPNLVQGWISF